MDIRRTLGRPARCYPARMAGRKSPAPPTKKPRRGAVRGDPPPRAEATDAALSLARDMAIDNLLHAAAVKAGAGAVLKVVLDGVPLLKPFVPTRLRRAAGAWSEERVQRHLVRAVYARHGLKPARWEIEGVLAVAQSQGVLTPLATRSGVQALLSAWIPAGIADAVMRYTPLDPLITAAARAVAATWAAGRYADGVCRLRRAGADWLPAPVTGMLKLTPAKLRDWSAEALSLALPPLKLMAGWGPQEAAAHGTSGKR